MKSEDSKPKIEDKFSEAWNKLGSPISSPLLNYLLAVIQYAIDNYFFIKNTWNALHHKEDPDMGETSPQVWIAGGTVGLHIISCVLISIIDSFNKDAISGFRGKHLDNNHRRYAFLRIVAHVTLTMKLFRYTTSYLENRRKNQHLHKFRVRRNRISEREIQFVVDQKKNQLIEYHYDLVESFFKTVPAALLQVYFMFKTNPEARLRLNSISDMDRFATVFFTIITVSVTSANYQESYMHYKKALHFQDCFRCDFEYGMNLKISENVNFVTSVIAHILTTGIRISFYSILLFWNPTGFLITISLLFLLNWFLIYKWDKTSWRFRAILENPLYGAPWGCFNFIDLWMNLFLPGVHYPKSLDHILNFYTTTIIGVFVFKGFSFLIPKDFEMDSRFLPTENSFSFTNDTSKPQVFNGLIYDSNIISNSTNGTTSNETFPNVEENILSYVIGFIIKYLLLGHRILTLNELSYAKFFYRVVQFMNIINLAQFVYTSLMNLLSLYDLDFPIQIANDFLISILSSLTSSLNSGVDSTDGLLTQTRQAETFLVFCLLRNSKFFQQFRVLKKISWKSVSEDTLHDLIKYILPKGEESGQNEIEKLTIWKRIKQIFFGIHRFCTPILYPALMREPSLDWDVDTDKSEIINYIQNQPEKMRVELLKLIDLIYQSNINSNGEVETKRLLLAVFCKNYNEIVRNYTSLRIKRTFNLMEISVEKQNGFGKESRKKKDFEIGHLHRLIEQIRGEVHYDTQ